VQEKVMTHFVRPDVQAFLAFLESLQRPGIHELAPADAREQMRAMRALTDLPVGELAVMRDLTAPGPGGDIPVRLFDARATREPGPALVYFHGGGFVLGDLDVYASICAELARTLDLPVISVDYRLSPENRWPAAPDDCEAAARWVAESPEALGRKVTSLVLAGDSAGGTLAIVASLDLRDKPARVPVIAQFLIYPATDMVSDYASAAAFGEGYLLTQAAMDWFSDCYAADLSHKRGSPLLADLAGMPPAVVLTAGLDPIRDQGRAFAAALAQAGVPLIFREAAGTIHGFITLRKAIPSGVGDVAGALAELKPLIVEAEANRVMAQAAG
jgi:acetyl esterase